MHSDVTNKRKWLLINRLLNAVRAKKGIDLVPVSQCPYGGKMDGEE